jgi:hypothetical protein
MDKEKAAEANPAALLSDAWKGVFLAGSAASDFFDTAAVNTQVRQLTVIKSRESQKGTAIVAISRKTRSDAGNETKENHNVYFLMGLICWRWLYSRSATNGKKSHAYKRMPAMRPLHGFHAYRLIKGQHIASIASMAVATNISLARESFAGRRSQNLAFLSRPTNLGHISAFPWSIGA